MQLWRGKYPTINPEDHADLEARAALAEVVDRLPRHSAEEQAHAGWLRNKLTQSAAHHLSALKANHAAGNLEAASRHGMAYGLAMKMLGHNSLGEPPPEVAALARDPAITKVTEYRPHPSDGVLLQALQARGGKPLAKGEAVPIAGVPAERHGDDVVWDVSHVLPREARSAGHRLHVRHTAGGMEGFLFREHGGRREPVASYGELDGAPGKPHAWEASRPTTPTEDAAVARAFHLRRAAARAGVAASGRLASVALAAARSKLG